MQSRLTRRRFTAGMLAAGAGVMTARSMRAAPGANERIRAGVIGCRTRGHQVAGSFLRTGRFEIAALCDCDSAMLDAGLSALGSALPTRPRTEKDFRRVLDDHRIDAVVVATPDHWHALMTVMALDAGKHVYVEKPASHNLLDNKAMAAAGKRHPRLTIQVGTQQRSAPHFKEARDFIAGGGLGTVGFARGWFVSDRLKVPITPDGDPPPGFDYDLWVGPAPMRPFNKDKVHYNWHFIRDFGTGDMGNWGAHWLDSIRHLLDLDVPQAVMAAGGTFVVHDGKEFPDTHTVLYEFPNLTVLWEMREWSQYPLNGLGGGVEIGGDKGTLVISRGGWTFHPAKGEPVKHKAGEMELAHAHNFADCIAGQASPAASIDQGTRTAVMIHLGNIALFTRHRLTWDASAETIVNDPEAAKLMSRPYRPPWKQPV
ncbi:MAG: Gfo/Idh/MocA family oxidoreductase [Phycisphaerae bacterium]|jgi:predicted dehydrogenase